MDNLFSAVESVSMAMQRSCVAEWNEFLQVLIKSVTHRLQAFPFNIKNVSSGLNADVSARTEAGAEGTFFP